MKEEKTIFESIRERFRKNVFSELLNYVSDKNDIKVIKCIYYKGEAYNTEEADSFKIYKAPKSGIIKIVATFDHPKNNSNCIIIYYKDKILTRHKVNFVADGTNGLTVENEIGFGVSKSI